MSVSDMNVSWSTPSIRSESDTEKSSVFLTDIKHVESKRPKCVSAKHSGMRFGSWPEPKPLRSRCSSAVYLPPEPEYDKITQMRLKSAQRSVQNNTGEDRKNLIKRLSQPTKSSRWKTSSARAREVGIDMNYYSWSKMNVYKDYQRVLYGENGTVRRTHISKER